MWNPFKKKTEIPTFTKIEQYEHKDKYFIRTKHWDWLSKEQIFVASKNEKGNPQILTMEYWDQEMFLDATGEIKIKDYLHVLIEQYLASKMEIPNNLDVFMIETLENLNNDVKIIKFLDKKEKIQDEFRLPMSKVGK